MSTRSRSSRCSSSCGGELLRARCSIACLERLARLVGGLAGGGALARAAARRRCAAGSAARPCGPRYWIRTSSSAAVSRRRAIACSASARMSVDPLGHCGRHPTAQLVEGDGRRHRGVERVGRDRDVRDVVGAARRPRPAARRARSRPGASTTLALERHTYVSLSAKVLAAARRRRVRARSSRPGDRPTARRARAGPRTRAPIDARTAFGPYGSAVPGPSATRGGAERLRRAQHRADVARVVDAVQVHAQRPGRRRRPPLLVHRERPRARAEARRRRQQRRLDLDARQAAARRAYRSMASTRRRRPPTADPRPRPRTARRARASAGAGGACGSP